MLLANILEEDEYFQINGPEKLLAAIEESIKSENRIETVEYILLAKQSYPTDPKISRQEVAPHIEALIYEIKNYPFDRIYYLLADLLHSPIQGKSIYNMAIERAIESGKKATVWAFITHIARKFKDDQFYLKKLLKKRALYYEPKQPGFRESLNFQMGGNQVIFSLSKKHFWLHENLPNNSFLNCRIPTSSILPMRLKTIRMQSGIKYLTEIKSTHVIDTIRGFKIYLCYDGAWVQPTTLQLKKKFDIIVDSYCSFAKTKNLSIDYSSLVRNAMDVKINSANPTQSKTANEIIFLLGATESKMSSGPMSLSEVETLSSLII